MLASSAAAVLDRLSAPEALSAASQASATALAPFSQNSDQHLHFGLGECNEDAKVSVFWSDGTQDTKTVSRENYVVSLGKL